MFDWINIYAPYKNFININLAFKYLPNIVIFIYNGIKVSKFTFKATYSFFWRYS